MAEREKVLNDLRELCEYLFHEYKVCYQGDEEDAYNRFLVANNALNLLKEQEPVEPIKLENWWKCPSCSGNIIFNMKYCPGCGRKVKWDRWLTTKRY